MKKETLEERMENLCGFLTQQIEIFEEAKNSVGHDSQFYEYIDEIIQYLRKQLGRAVALKQNDNESEVMEELEAISFEVLYYLEKKESEFNKASRVGGLIHKILSVSIIPALLILISKVFF